jgi:hypothetical protein
MFHVIMNRRGGVATDRHERMKSKIRVVAAAVKCGQQQCGQQHLIDVARDRAALIRAGV